MPRQQVTLDTQTAYATSSRTVNFDVPEWARGAVFFWRISAVAGTTPIADCKLQFTDPTSAQSVDVDGATFAQQTAASTQYLVLDPDVTADATGNARAAAAPLSSEMAAVFTFDRTSANETYTYTLTADFYG